MKITDVNIKFDMYLRLNPYFTGILRNIIEGDLCTGYFVNGKHHREDGPAYTQSSGLQMWFLNGRRHFLKAQYDHELINYRMRRIIDK
jgi:hypothetical protein